MCFLVRLIGVMRRCVRTPPLLHVEDRRHQSDGGGVHVHVVCEKVRRPEHEAVPAAGPGRDDSARDRRLIYF